MKKNLTKKLPAPKASDMTAFGGRVLESFLKSLVFVFYIQKIWPQSLEELENMAPQNPHYLQDILVLPEIEKVLSSEAQEAKNEVVKEVVLVIPSEEKKPEITLKLPSWPQLLVVAAIIFLFVLYRYRQRRQNRFKN